MIFIILKQNEEIVYERLVQNKRQQITAPLFDGEIYQIDIFNSNAQKIISKQAKATRNGLDISLPSGLLKDHQTDVSTICSYVAQLVSSHDGYDNELRQKMEAIENMHPNKAYSRDQVRGGRLEHLFNMLLLHLQKLGILDRVEWRGGVDQYGIPHPAPGRSRSSLGSPDVLAYVDVSILVFELTLIGKYRRQWSQEGESVPDHVLKIKKQNPKKDVIGIFSAPDFFRPEHLKAVAASSFYDIDLRLITLDKLMALLSDPNISKRQLLDGFKSLDHKASQKLI